MTIDREWVRMMNTPRRRCPECGRRVRILDAGGCSAFVVHAPPACEWFVLFAAAMVRGERFAGSC